MSFLFTHLIAGWAAGKAFEFIFKRKLSTYTWLFLLAGTIIPDLDFLIDWTLKTDIHRTITHSLTFAVIFPLFVFTILKLTKDPKSKYYSVALSIGIITHFLMDMQSHIGVALLWPSPVTFSYKGLKLVDHSLPSLFNSSAQQTISFLKKLLWDAALGAGWLFYFGLRKRIRF